MTLRTATCRSSTSSFSTHLRLDGREEVKITWCKVRRVWGFGVCRKLCLCNHGRQEISYLGYDTVSTKLHCQRQQLFAVFLHRREGEVSTWHKQTFLIPSSLTMIECTDAVPRPTFNEMWRNLSLLPLSNNALISRLPSLTSCLSVRIVVGHSRQLLRLP